MKKTGTKFGFSTPKLPDNYFKPISYKSFVKQCHQHFDIFAKFVKIFLKPSNKVILNN